MIKVGSKEDVKKLIGYPDEVICSVEDVITCLDENYGSDRDVDEDMGGYLLVIESDEDFSEIRKNTSIDIKDQAAPEFVDLIKCADGQIYTNSLVLCNNEFGISFICPLEILPDNFKQYM